MPKDFRLYMSGQVHFHDIRVTTPIRFAHITDLHLPPVDRSSRPAQYAHAVDWWDREFGHPHEKLAPMLDDAKDHGVDFVLMGGDNIDVYDARTADHIVELCQQRNLTCYFSFGNHDFESYEIRYVTHDHVPKVRDENGRRLMAHWSMTDRYYSFEVGPVRFIVLDSVYRIVEGGLAGFYDAAQVNWLEDQLRHDGPIIVFYHIPFRTAANEDRLQLIWNGYVAGRPKMNRAGGSWPRSTPAPTCWADSQGTRTREVKTAWVARGNLLPRQATRARGGLFRSVTNRLPNRCARPADRRWKAMAVLQSLKADWIRAWQRVPFVGLTRK